MSTVQIGDFGMVATYGSGVDKLAGELIRWGTDSPVNHAFVVVGVELHLPASLPMTTAAGLVMMQDGVTRYRIVEAEPSGARYGYADEYDSITWSSGRLPVHLTPTDTQRAEIVEAAHGMIGTPYGWEDIAAIALAQHRTGSLIGSDSALAKRISSRHTLICSQLVDLAYHLAGVELFDDGRLPGLVSPGDLDRLLLPEAAAA